MKRIETPALLVRSVSFGESDVIATFFTEEAGKLSAVVRGARRSQKRFGGALEPIHELFITLDDKGRELLLLKEARLGRPREGIVRSLDAMEAAGRALRWVRHLCPSRTPEPSIWSALRALFDVLDALGHGASAESGLSPVIDQHLAVFGFGLLAEVGYAIDLTRCARCGKACPESRPAFVDAAGGGLVCMTCGGARRTLSAAARKEGLRALSRGGDGKSFSMKASHAAELVAIAEEAMSAHADFDPNAGS